jgi:D-threo-aldose 1-dehydrogenase
MPSPRLKRRQLTTRNGVTLSFSELGLGTAPLGNLYGAIDEKTAQATLAAAWEVGCRVFDTAPLYGYGLAETRLNGFLREKPRDAFVLSTKVGRLISVCPFEERSGQGKFFDTPSRRETFDYSYDGVMRSVEFSFARLGLDRIDILLCHDVDAFTHGSPQARDERIGQFMSGGYRALEQLRASRTIHAIGAGLNEWQAAEHLARLGDFDIFLLAGRYTLLEQDALISFLPYCEARKIGILLGGPFNSGILASGPRPGAFYNYEPAPKPVLNRVRQIDRVCAAHGVKLAEVALRFPLGHKQVVSVLPGARKPAEVRRNAAMLGRRIPAALWRDLKNEGLMRTDAPLPR